MKNYHNTNAIKKYQEMTNKYKSLEDLLKDIYRKKYNIDISKIKNEDCK
jgi:hypothetical protein